MSRHFVKSTVYKRTTKPVTYSLLNLACVLVAGLVSLLLTSESHALTCPTLSKWDVVVVQNVGTEEMEGTGLNVRRVHTTKGNIPKGQVYDGTTGTIMSEPVLGPRYIWYYVKWDTRPTLEGWSVGIYAGAKVIATTLEAGQKDELVEALFQLPSGSADTHTRHDYNDYECNWPGDPYIGGHSGWDVVIDSENPVFHALIGGELIPVAEDDEYKDDFNTIAVYNADHDITVLYLHADQINVSKADPIITEGQPLGIQGDTGPRVTGAHVHIEVIDGEWGTPSAGTNARQERIWPSMDPVPKLYEVRQSYEDEQPGTGGGGNEFLRSDVNRDDRVDILDLLLVWTHINKDPKVFGDFDVNGDGFINREDILEVAENMELPGDGAAPVAFSHNPIEGITIQAGQVYIGSPSVSPESIQQLLNIIREVDDGSLVFRQSIAMLERVLAAMTPGKTVLLANYPNPFNPETWIPYELAEPADVTVYIYSVKGDLIRSLALGHQPVGIYVSRGRAAYWDGKNEVGESVASGVYFYTLTAGGFTATRKMLILK